MAHFSVMVGLLVVLGQAPTAPVSPSQPRPAAPPPRTTDLGTPLDFQASTRSFDGLFAPARQRPAPPSAQAEPEVQTVVEPKVVCGTVVVPAERATDPGMIKSPPTGVTFTIRVLTPPACWN